MAHVYKHYSAVIAVEIILWHMQENLAPHRWWKLGKSLEEYMLWSSNLGIKKEELLQLHDTFLLEFVFVV
jgi:hypothetical protein